MQEALENWLVLRVRGRDRGRVERSACGTVKSVDAVGMTVSDMDRSVEFFNQSVAFEKISQTSKWRAASTRGFKESSGQNANRAHEARR